MDPRSSNAEAGPATLLSLPPELLLEITSHLPLAARTALKLANRTLYARTPPLNLHKVRPSTLDPCARLAIAAHLTNDPTRQRCPLCKHWYPHELFPGVIGSGCAGADSATPELLRRGCDAFGGPGAVSGPPGACGWHRGQVCRVVEGGWAWSGWGAALCRRGVREGWYAADEAMCYHCGAVRRWRECGCDCETCGSRSVRTYTRVVRTRSDVDRFVFFVRDGETWVREWRGQICADVKVQDVD